MSQVEGGDGSGWCQECMNGDACAVLFCPLTQLLFIGFGKGWMVKEKTSPSTGRHWENSRHLKNEWEFKQH